jgi:hypothetical protein
VVQRYGARKVKQSYLKTYPFSVMAQSARRTKWAVDSWLAWLAAEAPFVLFKNLVRECEVLQDVAATVLDTFEAPPARPTARLANVEQRVRALPGLAFSAYFDHMGHVTFSRFNAPRSSRVDITTKAKCAALLEAAPSFADLLRGLGAPLNAPKVRPHVRPPASKRISRGSNS